MKAEKKPCPCGCKKFMAPPIIDCQEATLSSDEADELVRRWNAFEDHPGPISMPMWNSRDSENSRALHHLAVLIGQGKMRVQTSSASLAVNDQTVIRVELVSRELRTLI